MDIVLKKAIKDFKKLGWRSYLIIAVIVLSLGGGLGLYYAIVAAMPMMNNYFDDVNHADCTYQLAEDTWITQDQLDDLADLQEVDDYTGRLFYTASLELSHQEDRKYILLVGLDPDIKRPKVYDYNIIEGKNFNNDDDKKSAVIDNTFAEKNDLDVGDEIEIDGLNDAELEIVGTCNAPEFVVMTSNPEYLFPIEGSMAVIFLSKDTLKNYIIDYFIHYNSTTSEDLTASILYYQTVDYNNIAVTFKDDISDGQDEIEEYLEDNCNVKIEKVEKFEDSYAYTFMKSDVEDSGELMMLLLFFMALMGGIIVYIIFNRYVYSQKQQIGILLALGYTKKDILKYFLFNVLTIGIISIPTAIFVGFTLGYIILNEMLVEMTKASPNEFAFIFIPEVMYLGLFIGALIVFLSTFFSIRKINKKIIAELIYEQAEVTRKIKKVKKSSSRNIKNKLIIRNLFRNKKRLIFTIIAMTFSLLIVSASQSLLDSMYYNVDRTFKSKNSQVKPNEKWDLNIIFQTSVNTSNPNSIVDEIEVIDGVKDIELYSKGLIKIKGKKDQNLVLQGIDLDDDDFHSFTWQGSEKENSAPKDDDEIVISSVHSKKLDKEVGDKLTIENAAGEEFKFRIVGIHEELIVTPYVTLDAGQEICHNSDTLIDGIYIILDKNADKDDIIDKIYDMGNIEVIFDAEKMNEKGIEFLENYAIVLQIIIFYTLIVSFFIVFYNSVMNIYDKNYEYGILRSLGYPKKSIFKIILLENVLQGLFPIILALIFTYPLTLQMGQIYQENFPLEIIVGIPAILMITIPPLILYLLGSIIGLKTVYHQNPYEQVQVKFVG